MGIITRGKIFDIVCLRSRSLRSYKWLKKQFYQGSKIKTGFNVMVKHYVGIESSDYSKF